LALKQKLAESDMNQDLDQTLQQFTEDLKQIYGDKLLAIILYGSAASGEYVEGRSNINCLVLLKEVTPDELKKCTERLPEWHKQGMSTPLFVDPPYIRSSVDVFPMEFLDMKQRYRLLFGQDFLHSLELNLEYLRFQCEQELKGKMLKLRQLYLEKSGSEKQLAAYLAKSISSFMVHFRALLHLKGMSPPHSAEEIFGSLAQIGLPTKATRRVYGLKHGGVALGPVELNALFKDYLSEVQSAVKCVEK
jgi:hypothetical protein